MDDIQRFKRLVMLKHNRLTVRTLDAAEVADGLRLSIQAGWNQTAEDWRRFLELEPDGCFAATWDGRLVGTATTCVLGSVAWIAMVLVDQACRRQGIGTQLVEHTLQYLEQRAVRTVRLDATALGRPVYERLGFVARFDLVRFQGVAAPTPGGWVPSVPLVPASRDPFDGMVSLDRRASGADRRRLLERLAAERPDAVRLAVREGRVLGYGMLRPGTRASYIGPVIADDAEAGRGLYDWAWRQCAGQPVFLDIPWDNRPAIEWAQAQGLSEQRRFTRMDRGTLAADQPCLLWASSGPEKG